MSQPPYPQQPGVPQGQQPGIPQGAQYAPTYPYVPQQPATKPKKPWYKRWWVWVIGVVVLISFISQLGGGGEDDAATPAETTTQAVDGVVTEAPVVDPTTAEPVTEAPAVGIGGTLTVGDVQYTLLDYTPGVTSLGNEYFNTTPQGQFVIVTLTVKNIGQDAITVIGDMVALRSPDGTEYSASDEAWAYLDDSPLAKDINPGNSLGAKFVFDIPVDAQPTVVEVSEGFWGMNTAEFTLG